MITPKTRQRPFTPDLRPKQTPGATVDFKRGGVWRLTIPPGRQGEYRLAQLDDYTDLPRSSFRWTPPIRLNLRARACARSIAGTWGFGFWNDPFSLSLGFGGGTRRTPTLPNATWFFFASPPNHLSLDDDLPGHGNLASTFRSIQLPTLVLSLGGLGLPLLLLPAVGRLFRTLSRGIIKQSITPLPISVTEWHEYSLEWSEAKVQFSLDRDIIAETHISPEGPLSLVIWIDNQFFALPPDGHIRYGSLANPEPVWIELEGLEVREY